MTDKDRMMEKIDVFCDADNRAGLSDEDIRHCPTLAEAMKVSEG